MTINNLIQRFFILIIGAAFLAIGFLIKPSENHIADVAVIAITAAVGAMFILTALSKCDGK